MLPYKEKETLPIELKLLIRDFKIGRLVILDRLGRLSRGWRGNQRFKAQEDMSASDIEETGISSTTTRS